MSKPNSLERIWLVWSRTSNCWQKEKIYDLSLNAMTTLTTKENRTPLSIVAAIIAISAVASLFLCWLVYYHVPADVTGTHLLFLPALNALLNALSAIALVTGFCFIRAKRVSKHRAAMFTAFVFSSVFLVTYITNHALHGDMRFQGQGPIRYVYFPLLISHIGLSVVALPMILIIFSLAQRSLSRAPASGPIHFPDLALRLGHRRHSLRHARSLSLRQPIKTANSLTSMEGYIVQGKKDISPPSQGNLRRPFSCDVQESRKLA